MATTYYHVVLFSEQEISNLTYKSGNATFTYTGNPKPSLSDGTKVPKTTPSPLNGYPGDTLYIGDDVRTTFPAFVGKYYVGYIKDGSSTFSFSTGKTYTTTATVSGNVIPLPSTVETIVTYKGETISTADEDPPVSVTYNGSEIASLESGESATLKTAGQKCSTDITVGSVTLKCGGKYMEDDITVEVE